MPEKHTRGPRRSRPISRQTRRHTQHAGQKRPTIAELLETPGAMLTRSHLRTLGLERRAIDAVFRALPIVSLPGYSRPMVRAADYLAFVEESIYRDDRVRPT
jgi:hypothetical protein